MGTADLQGQLEPHDREVRLIPGQDKIRVVGGISRIATLIRQARTEIATPVIVVSAGDDLMGRYFHQFQGKAIFSLMRQAGYQILALGNHEFDRGPGVLGEALESGAPDTLCSDLQVTGTVMAGTCQPLLIRRTGGLSLGFFSLMTPRFPTVTMSGDVRMNADQHEVARSMVQELRRQGATVVIAVTHIGADQDRRLAAEVQGIDIIFGGHSHEYLPALEQVGRTLIVNGGEKGAAMVRLDVALDAQGHVIAESAHYALIPVSEDIEPDPAVETALKGWKKQLPAVVVLGKTEETWDLSKKSLRNRESGVADLITDLIRDRFGVDAVFVNSGAFRGDTSYPPGPVTDVMVRAIDEFENDIVLLELQGSAIRQILEHSAARIGSGGFLQVAGIRFVIDQAAPARVEGSGQGDPSVVRPGNRVSKVEIRDVDGSWRPLEPQRWYRVATIDFLVSRNGDGYSWFSRLGRNIHNTYSTMGSLLTDFLQEEKVVNPKKPDGRITIR